MENIFGKKIIFVTAHPDDESYAASGIIYNNFKHKGTNILICASAGEKGTSHLKEKITQKKLKEIRKKELKKAGDILGIGKIFYLNAPDGQVKKTSSNLKKIIKICKANEPDLLISFATDGISGHRDHINVGWLTKLAASKIRKPFYALSLPPKFNKVANRWLLSRKNSKHYINKISFKKPDIIIKVNKKIKVKALLCHKSQTENNKFTGYPEYAVTELLKNEYLSKTK